jgi:hypothetical protein
MKERAKSLSQKMGRVVRRIKKELTEPSKEIPSSGKRLPGMGIPWGGGY